MAKKRGFGILEIMISAAILSIVLFSLFSVFAAANKLNLLSSDKIRANFLAEEGLEAVRYLRDDGWTRNIAPLNSATDYYVSFNTSTLQWSIGATNPGQIDGVFGRVITAGAVYRDSNDDITASGGTLDPDTLKITSTVTWSASNTLSVETYLTDLFAN
ncbi:prepilin-type N-terminal cleavage/methylation domain-containing protein [Candidatus Giovannonibacteria bacterium]|nr:prepilin-type N-terminal cleavage/methylation domain-containing protein [Candidatus Giovannonibacteria bacterium]